MKGFIERLKNRLFNSEYYELSPEEIKFNERIKTHEVGDVIWASRFDFDWDNNKYNNGHQAGPYVVVGKTEDKLICAFCTSSDNKNFFIELENYPFFYKKTYLQKNKLKTVDHVSYFRSNYDENNHLNKKDIDKILKTYKYHNKVDRVYNDFGLINKFEIDSDIQLDIGDVVLHNNHYSVIIDKNGNGLECIIFDNFNPKTLEINFEEVNLNFQNKYVLDPSKVEYINTLSSRQLSIILKRYKEYLGKREAIHNNTLTRGSLIAYKNKYYYVYHIESNKAYLIELLKQDIENENTISLNNIVYLPNFENKIEIDINSSEYRTKYTMSEEELDLLKSKKKSYSKKKESKKKVKQEKKYRFDICSVIQSSKMFSMRYLVLGYYDDKILTIVFDSFIGGNIIYKEFDINDESLSICKQVNIVELKYIRENTLKFKELFSEKTMILGK